MKILVALASLLSLSALAAPPTAVVIFDSAGKGDKSFNDSASVGSARAQKELGITVREIEPRDQKSYIQIMESFASKKVPLIIGIGFTHTDAIRTVAKKFPNTHFALVDGLVEAPNVASLIFRENEGSYLAGYLAAKMTKTNKLGFIGGMEIPLIKRFHVGFVQGVKAVDKKNQVIQNFVGTTPEAWVNPSKAKEIAKSQFEKGVDIIFHAAGGSGMGVFDAAQENKKFAIGVDSNQNHLRPGHIITSMVKRVDNVVFDAIKSEKEGKFKSGVSYFGVANGGVDLAFDDYAKKLVPEKLIAEIESVKKDIASGKIKVAGEK